MQNYKRNCPKCGKDILYVSLDSFRHAKKDSKCRYCCNVIRGKSSNRKGCHHTDTAKQAISAAQVGRKVSVVIRIKMSEFQKKCYSDTNELKKMAIAVKQAMHRPDVRKRHVEALHRSQWLKVRMDRGQSELLEKWNGLGFHFEPNYQVHTDLDLFYVDGYDAERGVVLEYDSKYHKILGQQKKDVIRQQKIINALAPKKFWRYDAVNRKFSQVI